MDGCMGSECSWNTTEPDSSINNTALGLALGLGALAVVLSAVCTLISVITVLRRRSRRKSRISQIDSPKYHFDSISSLRKPKPSHTKNSYDPAPTRNSQESTINLLGTPTGKATTVPCKIHSQQSKRLKKQHGRNVETAITKFSNAEISHTKAIETQPKTQDNHITICLTKQNSNGSTEDVILDVIVVSAAQGVFEMSQCSSISNRPPLPTPSPTKYQDSEGFLSPSLEDSISPTPVTAIREQTTTLWWHRLLRQGKQASLETSGQRSGEISGNYVNEGMGPK